MAKFRYQAYDTSGGKLSGSVEAQDVNEAKASLKQQQLIITSIKEVSNSVKKTSFLASKKITLEELEFFTSELSILLKNGVKIDRGLLVLKKNKSEGEIFDLIDDLYQSVKKGMMLSEAMEKRQDVFSPLYINIVSLGEATGELPEVFDKLSEDLKFKSQLRSKVVQSLTYPMVILSVCILCVLFIFNYIVPQMSSLFEGLPELPIYTEILLGLSNWFQSYQWFLFIFIIASIIGIRHLASTSSGKRTIDEVMLKAPGVRNILLLLERIRFNSSLSMMLQAGISIDKALELSIGSVNSKPIAQGLTSAKENIKKGASLTESLSRSEIYPDFYLSLLEVGEESGKLTSVFDEITTRSRYDFESKIDSLTSLLEPVLILIMGAIVGGVVVTMLLSIMSVNEFGF